MDDETTDLDRAAQSMLGHVDDPEMAERIGTLFGLVVDAAREGRLEYLGLLVAVRQPHDETKLDIYSRAVYADEFNKNHLGPTIGASHAELGHAAETYDPTAPDPERILQ